MSEIFNTTLDKNQDDINGILEGTDLVKKILEISKDGIMFTFESNRHISKGYNAFVRKLANRIVEIQKKVEEANNILEAIPEWKEYCDGDLSFINNIENKPLASDPRKKGASTADDDIEYFFKIKAF